MRSLPKEGTPGHLGAKKRHFPKPSANRTLGAQRLARLTSCRTWFWFERPATFFCLPCLMICPDFSCFFFCEFYANQTPYISTPIPPYTNTTTFALLGLCREHSVLATSHDHTTTEHADIYIRSLYLSHQADDTPRIEMSSTFRTPRNFSPLRPSRFSRMVEASQRRWPPEVPFIQRAPMEKRAEKTRLGALPQILEYCCCCCCFCCCCCSCCCCCCCCCSHINSSLQCSPWPRDRLQRCCGVQDYLRQKTNKNKITRTIITDTNRIRSQGCPGVWVTYR